MNNINVTIMFIINQLYTIMNKMIGSIVDDNFNPQKIIEINGKTPLMILCENLKEIEAIQHVMKHNEYCYPEYFDKDGNSVLMIALEKRLMAFTDYFYKKFKDNFSLGQINKDGDNEFIIGCRMKNIRFVNNFIDSKSFEEYDVNAINTKGYNALLYLSQNGMNNEIQRIIEKFKDKRDKLDLTVKDELNQNILQNMIYNCTDETCLKFVENFKDKCGIGNANIATGTLLIQAINNHHTKLSAFIINNFPVEESLPKKMDYCGKTAFWYACQTKNKNIINLLWEKFELDVIVLMTNINNECLLDLIVDLDLIKIITKIVHNCEGILNKIPTGSIRKLMFYLLKNKNKGDENMHKEKLSIKLLDMFKGFSSDKITKIIMEDGSSSTLLYKACANGYAIFGIKLIDACGELCEPDYISSGNTALMYICSHTEKERVELIEKLIDTFGDKCLPDSIGSDNDTAFGWLLEQKHTNDIIIKFITTVGKKCQPGHKHKGEKTPLIRILESKSEDLALLLLNKFGIECNINASHKDKIALDLAIEKNYVKVISKLIELDNNTIKRLSTYNLNRLSNMVDVCNNLSHDSIQIIKTHVILKDFYDYRKSIISKTFNNDMLDEKGKSMIINKILEKGFDDDIESLINKFSSAKQIGLKCQCCFNLIIESIIIKPCNHINICKKCVNKVKTCPLCRKVITNTEKIYL